MQIINSLSNIAHDSKSYRDLVLAEDVLVPLLTSLSNWVRNEDFRSALVALKCCSKMVYWKDPDWNKVGEKVFVESPASDSNLSAFVQLIPLIKAIPAYLNTQNPPIIAEAGDILQSLFQSGLGTVPQVDALINRRLCWVLLRLLYR